MSSNRSQKMSTLISSPSNSMIRRSVRKWLSSIKFSNAKNAKHFSRVRARFWSTTNTPPWNQNQKIKKSSLRNMKVFGFVNSVFIIILSPPTMCLRNRKTPVSSWKKGKNPTKSRNKSQRKIKSWSFALISVGAWMWFSKENQDSTQWRKQLQTKSTGWNLKKATSKSD